METRHRTVVSIEVDAADIKNAGEDISRAFDPKTIDAFEKSIERMTRSLTQLAAQTAKVQKLGGGGGRGGGGGGREGGGGQQGGGGFWPTAVGSFSGTMAGNMVGRGMGAIGQAAQPSGFIQGIAGAVPGFGPALGPMVGALQTLYQSFAQVQGSLARSYGATGRTNSMAGRAAGFGVDPSESPGMMAELAARTGLKDEALGNAFESQLKLEKILGVRGAGSVVGAQMSGGGRVTDPGALMERSVSAGLSVGIQENRLDQYLQTVSSWVEHVRSEGIDFSVDSTNALIRGFGAMGFRGENAARTATTLADALKQAVTGAGAGGMGAGIAMGAALAVAKEYGGREDTSDLLAMVQNRDPRMIAKAREMINAAAGGDRNAARGIYGVLGITGQADVDKLMSDAEVSPDAGGEAGTALQRRTAGFRAVSGTSRHEAGLAMRRAAGGRQVSAVVQKMQDAELDLSLRLAPGIAEYVRKGMEWVESKLPGKGNGGLLPEIPDILNLLGGAEAQPGGPGGLKYGDAWKHGMDQGFGQSASEMLDAALQLKVPGMMVLGVLRGAYRIGNKYGPGFIDSHKKGGTLEGIRNPTQGLETLGIKAGEGVQLPESKIQYAKPAAEIGRPSADIGSIGTTAIGEISPGATLIKAGQLLIEGGYKLDQQNKVPETAVGH